MGVMEKDRFSIAPIYACYLGHKLRFLNYLNSCVIILSELS